MLLERVLPGTSIADHDDEVATAELALAMQSMWRPVPPGCRLPSVAEECLPVFSADLPGVDGVRKSLRDLLAAAPEPVVLHGDLHHDNLLRGPAGWVAIDPHGVTGDPAYDVGPLFLNPWAAEVSGLVARRLAVLETVLGLDRDRMRRWAQVRAVLSAAWTLESTGLRDDRALAIAAALEG